MPNKQALTLLTEIGSTRGLILDLIGDTEKWADADERRRQFLAVEGAENDSGGFRSVERPRRGCGSAIAGFCEGNLGHWR